VLTGLIDLGIRAFNPRPQYSSYDMDSDGKDRVQDIKVYGQKMQEYNIRYFIAASVIGLAVFLAAFLVLFKSSVAVKSVPLGGMIAGFIAVISGYSHGWDDVDTRLLFFIGLFVATILLGSSAFLAYRFSKKQVNT